ncbi:MAG: transglycosylase SLT domain-containing protein [Myxococcaceae bacterium]
MLLPSPQLAALLAVLVSGSATAQAPPSTAAPRPLDPSLASDVVELDNPAFPPFPATAAPRLTPLATLLPAMAGGPQREAAAALDAGQAAAALKLLGNLPDTPGVQYLRTLAALRLASTAALAATMEQLAEKLPQLADRCALNAALAREELGELVAARRLFASVPKDSLVVSEARLGTARVLRRMGDLPGAAVALAPLSLAPAPASGRDLAAEALFLRAELAREQNHVSDERAELLLLWTRHPRSVFSPQAERRLAGYVSPTAQVERAEALVDVQRSAEALRLLEPLRVAPPDPLGCRAQLARGRALRKEHRHAEVERVLAPVVARCTLPDLRVRALYVLAASQAVLHPDAAVATYELLAQQYPQHPYADDALYLAAELRAAAGDFAGALAGLEAVSTRYPGGDFAGEALFKTFWLHHRLDDDAAGLAALDRVEELFARAEDSYDVERARYWRARVLEAQGQRPSAVAVWTSLAREHPTTYYGLLARARLAEREPGAALELAQGAVPTGAAPQPTLVAAGSLLANRHYLAAVQLGALGQWENATQELLAVRRSEQPRDVTRVLVQAIARTGDLRAAQALARTELSWALKGPLRAEVRDVWEAAYPRAYRDLVERYCKSPGVDPDLLQALMREESALDPRALSWAGALGLTQLMLPTAQAVARELRLGKPSTEGLFDPALNIHLGAAYLGRLLARFGNNAVYALASYNAGASTVDRWRAQRTGLELDAFVEEIPLAETRGYVKRVLRSYNTYRLLDGQPLLSSTLAEVEPVEARATLPRPR